MGRIAMQELSGMAGSPGIAIGQAVCILCRRDDVYRFPLDPGEIEAELARFHEAVEVAASDLDRIRERADRELGDELAAVFEAHAAMLRDRAFLDRVEERIRSEEVNAEWAVHETATELQERFDRLEVEHFRQRRDDLHDVVQHLQRALGGIGHHELSEIEGDVVIVADDLTPSEAVRLGRERVVAFAVETGGSTSHTTIIARSLNIPLVAGLEGVTQKVTDADPVIVDGSEGRVVLHPTDEALLAYRERRRLHLEREDELGLLRSLPSVTRDRIAVELLANIDLPEEIEDAVRFGAAGVGLYRSEFIYIEKSPELPTEEEHFTLYRSLVERVQPHPVIIRTYDLGGRKLAREVMDTREENPVLGLRGVRLTLARPEIFRVQLRALFRACAYGELRVMLPLVTALEEVRDFKAFCEEILDELEAEGARFSRSFPLGVMIEVPAAVLIAEELAREVDFLSIGTNDLIQYSMAVDRNNEHVAHLYRPLHPAILRMIGSTVESARRAGTEVSICGEMAADPKVAPVLVGLGLRRLSMRPRAIPEIKRRIRRLDASEWLEISRRLSALGTADEVDRALDRHLEALAPAGVEAP